VRCSSIAANYGQQCTLTSGHAGNHMAGATQWWDEPGGSYDQSLNHTRRAQAKSEQKRAYVDQHWDELYTMTPDQQARHLRDKSGLWSPKTSLIDIRCIRLLCETALTQERQDRLRAKGWDGWLRSMRRREGKV
jgi:hypothetical protein